MANKTTSSPAQKNPDIPMVCVPSERRLADIIDTYMAANENTEPPKLYHLWTILSCLSAALQRRCWLDWYSIRVYPNLYVALVGPPGATRKGTAMGFGRELLSQANLSRTADSTTRAAFIASLEKCKTSFIDTVEGKIIDHCSLTAFSSELTVLLGHNDSMFLDTLTDLFDCPSYFEYDTKTQGRNTINNAWLSIFGATTQGALRTALPEHAFTGGFLSRFIAVCEEQRYKAIPCPERSEEEEQFWSLVKEDYLKVLQLSGRFTFTEGYRRAYCAWYERAAKNPPFTDPKLDAYTSRRSLHLWKLSMLANASRTNSMVLDTEDLERSLEWLLATERRMPRAFSGLGKHQMADVMSSVLGFIAHRKEVTLGEILKIHKDDVNYDDLEILIRTLQTMGAVEVQRSPIAAATVIRIIEEDPA